jgi:7-cyano-7-deazaguanine synthase
MTITDGRRRSVVLLSGGMDSATLLFHLQGCGHEVFPLAVNYGQRHVRELRAARAVAQAAGAVLREVDLSNLQRVMGGSSQTEHGIAVPHGHYADDSMRATVVPNRNMVLLAIAGAYAVSLKAGQVGYAAHAGDHAVYPDCRPEFADAMEEALLICDYDPIYLRRPFIAMSKADIVRHGLELGVPFELTYSCYEGGEGHCRKCGTCVERTEAFQIAGLVDPAP